MPAKTSLPVGWQTLLENPAGAKPYLEVILDPDGENITLNGVKGVRTISQISGEIEIDPAFSGEVILQDIEIVFSDPNEYYASFTGRSGAKFKRIQRITAEASTNNPMDLNAGLGTFAIGDVVTITDGDNLESFTLTSASANQIGWVGALGATYATGSMVATLPITNNLVQVNLRLDGNANSLTVFKGLVREPFVWTGQEAVLRVDNLLSQFFDKPVRIYASSPTPTLRASNSGHLVTSFTWNDGALSSLDAVTVYTGAYVGEWTITLGAGGSTFQITGPNDYSNNGSTLADFYDVTDATDSQIKIAAADWNSPTEGDVLTFRVSANFEAKTVAEIIYELLSDYAGLADDYIDVGGTGVTDETTLDYSFNEAYHTDKTNTITLSFDEPHTIMQALLVVLPHSLAQMGQMLSGKLRLLLFHPDFGLAALTPTVITNPLVGHDQFINEFIVEYAFDYVTREHAAVKTWPLTDITNASYKLYGKKKSQTLFCPGINN
jgi:hypothetical protein